ncbi:MAG: YdbL family protein [Pseudomonadota bacterium]
MTLMFRVFALVAIGAASMLVGKIGPQAEAQGSTISSAKQAGVVGERIDGYLGFVENGPADRSLRRQVQEINAKRRAVYDELASDTDTTTEQVARVTAEKQIARAPQGQFYMNERGRWERKQ